MAKANSTRSTSATRAPKGSSPITKTLDDFSNDAMNAAANVAVGVGFVKTIFESVGELSQSNPHLAKRLAEAGRYWAETIEQETLDFQDRIEQIWEGGAA